MRHNILIFPVRPAPRLARVWFATGDPARPLTAKWIAMEEDGSASLPPRLQPRMLRACI